MTDVSGCVPPSSTSKSGAQSLNRRGFNALGVGYEAIRSWRSSLPLGLLRAVNVELLLRVVMTMVGFCALLGPDPSLPT